jgi:hypothetical protein
MNALRRLFLVAGLLVASSAAAASASAEVPGVAQENVTVSFASYGSQRALEPDFYRSDGLVFPDQRCGVAGCDSWWVGFVQGEPALVQTPLLGPVTARFTRPVSSLSVRVAPAVQGTATYTLTALNASGDLIAAMSLTVTQDFEDPVNTGFGYFTLALEDLPEPAHSFTLDSVFVRSSFGWTNIEYGVSTISYSHWGG